MMGSMLPYMAAPWILWAIDHYSKIHLKGHHHRSSPEVQGLRGAGHRCGTAMAAAGERSESVRGASRSRDAVDALYVFVRNTRPGKLA